jgi:hypothetical protein
MISRRVMLLTIADSSAMVEEEEEDMITRVLKKFQVRKQENCVSVCNVFESLFAESSKDQKATSL